MIYKTTKQDGTIVVEAESIAEAGFMYWISERFSGSAIKISFDTALGSSGMNSPVLYFSTLGFGSENSPESVLEKE